jgi:hypothetical protein
MKLSELAKAKFKTTRYKSTQNMRDLKKKCREKCREKAKFKTTRYKSTSNNMKKKKSKSEYKKSTGNSSGVFSGKILGFKVPIIGDALKNKTVQKAIAGAGIVSLALSIAQLVNNPTVDKMASNKLARLALAGTAGDITGVATEFLREGGVNQIKGVVTGNGNGSKSSIVSMSGNGVA